MPVGTRIQDLIPHQGAMCLLDEVASWTPGGIVCRTRSHLSADNPLCGPAGRLGAVCGIEYGLQAAALHGALTASGTKQKPGYLASLRDVELKMDRLDNPAFDVLEVEAVLELRDRTGLIYRIFLCAENGCQLLSGRVAIAIPE